MPRGFTLLELLVAVSIALFLIGGLLTVEQYNHVAFVNQNQLSQIQDSERVALTVMADVIQQAGYFPDPTSFTSIGSLPASGSLASGQAIGGTSNAAAPGDAITVRYVSSGNSGPLNCSGTTGSASQLYTNTFSVVNGQLVCTMNGTQYPLIGGGFQNVSVQNLTIRYGVKTNFAVDNFNVDTYLTAAQMSAANWNSVISVVIALTLNNPLYVAGQGQPQTLTAQRVVNVMNKTGVKL